MAEEFQAGICGGNWWNSSRAATAFIASPSPNCSSVINDIGNFGGCWPSHDLVDMKAKSSDESSDGSMVFQDIQKPSSGCGGATTTTTMSPDSTFHMMGIGLSNSPPATTIDWNQSLLVRGNGRAEGNYNHILPEGLNNFSTGSESNSEVVAAGNQGFSMDQQQPLNFITSSGDCTTSLVTSTTFPISSTSYGYPSSLLQTLFDSNSPPPPQQQSLYDYRMNLSDFNSVPSLPKFPPLVKPKQQVSGGLHLANKTPYWNAPASALNENRATFFPPTQSQFLTSTYEEKPNCPNLSIKSNKEEIRDSGSAMKKNCSEPAFKRPRLETPSPLPTFKVRKEKLGDRITALQQLVSPFGKTDTASVLHEAIEYIKLLHDQVNVLSTPYMKNGAAMQRQQIHDKVKDAEGGKQDLRSRGLCLVPVSSTFPVATEAAPEFWTPSFGGTFSR